MSLGRFFPGQSLFLMSAALSLSAALCMISVINHFDTLFWFSEGIFFGVQCHIVVILLHCTCFGNILMLLYRFFYQARANFSTSALLILV